MLEEMTLSTRTHPCAIPTDNYFRSNFTNSVFPLFQAKQSRHDIHVIKLKAIPRQHLPSPNVHK